MSDEDQGPVIDALKQWFADHPGSGDPDEAIRGLGLPDMTGIPENPGLRTRGQQRDAAAARDVRQHAEYALRCRDNPLPVRHSTARDGGTGDPR